MSAVALWGLMFSVATAAPVGPNDGATQIPFGCTPQPINGTVAQSVVGQARETNGQLYGAAAFAERVVFPRLDRKSSGGWDDRDGGAGVFGFDVNTISGIAYVPSKEVGADCPADVRYLQHRVDLYSAANALAFKSGPVGFFYVASVTGDAYATRVGSGFLPYAYGLGAAFGGYLAPFQPGFLNHQEPTKSRASDYIVGGQIDVWTLGSVRAGYVGSKGAFVQGSGRLVKLFGTAAIKDFSQLSAAEYLRAGLDRQIWGSGDVARKAGATSLFVRRLRYRPQRASAADAATDFTSIHLQQTAVGTVFDVDLAAGRTGDTTFVHIARIGLHTPAFSYVRDIESDAIVADDLESIQRGEFNIDFGATVGRVELPSLPFYGVEGGGAFSGEAMVVLWMPLEPARLSISFAVRYNTPEFLDAFPYGQNAVNSTFAIRLVL